MNYFDTAKHNLENSEPIKRMGKKVKGIAPVVIKNPYVIEIGKSKVSTLNLYKLGNTYKLGIHVFETSQNIMFDWNESEIDEKIKSYERTDSFKINIGKKAKFYI